MSMADCGAAVGAGVGVAGGSSARTSAECITIAAKTTEHNGWSRIDQDRTGSVANRSSWIRKLNRLRHLALVHFADERMARGETWRPWTSRAKRWRIWCSWRFHWQPERTSLVR